MSSSDSIFSQSSLSSKVTKELSSDTFSLAFLTSSTGSVLYLIAIIGFEFFFLSDLFTGNYTRMIIVLLFGFVLSVSDVYIRPALTSRYVDVHPLILLIGFLAGPLVFGIVGLILGPFFLGVTYAILKTYKEERKSDGA